MPVRVPQEDRVEAGARALFNDDCRRNVGLEAAPYIWPRVRPEYQRKASIVLAAADRVERA